MTKKATRAKKISRNSTPKSAVKQGQGEATNPKTMCESLIGAKSVREWLCLSQSEIGIDLARLLKQPKALSKQMVNHYERLPHLEPRVIRAYGRLVANRLTDICDRDVAVSVKVNSPWHIMPWLQCNCGAWFALDRSTLKRCPKCRAGK